MYQKGVDAERPPPLNSNIPLESSDVFKGQERAEKFSRVSLIHYISHDFFYKHI